MILLDDHLVRDLVAGELPSEVEEPEEEFATTNLWLVRLAGALTRQGISSSLSGSIKGLGEADAMRFRQHLTERVELLTVLPMRDIVWSIAELQQRHREAGHLLSTAMAEVLAAAHALGATIAVAEDDVGPGLQAAAAADDISFRIVARG